MILVDRLEDQTVILEISEDEQPVRHMTVAAAELGISVAEGDILVQTAEGWQVDQTATNHRKRQLFRRFRRMIQNGT